MLCPSAPLLRPASQGSSETLALVCLFSAEETDFLDKTNAWTVQTRPPEASLIGRLSRLCENQAVPSLLAASRAVSWVPSTSMTMETCKPH
ncbi:Hydroxyacid-Oxoacid Transhydrogenase [Manis pentadactyla]|nr:Hydroxyacid-Oxoacid Transhydrogenase [Manis pentadactyla]